MKHCMQCGSSIGDDSVFCPKCGTKFAQETEPPAQARYEGASGSSAGPVRQEPAGSNDAQLWMLLNIVAAILCCLIPAVVGIVFGAIGMTSYSHGDYIDAEKKTSVSKWMFLLSACLGALKWFVLLTSFFMKYAAYF